MSDKKKHEPHAAQRGFRNIKKRIKVWELKQEHRGYLKSDPDLLRIMTELHTIFTTEEPFHFEHKWTRLHLYYERDVEEKIDNLKKEYQEILESRYPDFIEKV